MSIQENFSIKQPIHVLPRITWKQHAVDSVVAHNKEQLGSQANLSDLKATLK